MQACDLKIRSTADGEEKRYDISAELELSPLFVRLSYREEGSNVLLEASERGVFIKRTGDYTLRLLLRAGERTTGTIGIGASEGEVEISTSKLDFFTDERSFTLRAEYALHFGGELQRMKLCLKARLKEETR